MNNLLLHSTLENTGPTVCVIYNGHNYNGVTSLWEQNSWSNARPGEVEWEVCRKEQSEKLQKRATHRSGDSGSNWLVGNLACTHDSMKKLTGLLGLQST